MWKDRSRDGSRSNGRGSGTSQPNQRDLQTGICGDATRYI